jgi:cytosine/adenosine deaminase-related metal-dependent hydrolase
MLKNGITTVVDFFSLNGRGNEYALATIKAAEELGIRLVFARTFMNTLSIFHEMKMAALVQKSLAGDPQAITAGELIEKATVGGARIAELPIGSLSVGQRADFTVIDLSDIELVPGRSARVAHGLFHVRPGHSACVRAWEADHQGRQVCGLDETDLRRRAVGATRRFFARPGQVA